MTVHGSHHICRKHRLTDVDVSLSMLMQLNEVSDFLLRSSLILLRGIWNDGGPGKGVRGPGTGDSEQRIGHPESRTTAYRIQG